jgi:plasmid replication initiation protein
MYWLEYVNFKDFRLRILEYSQKELLEHCDIYFSWDIAAKERKKITALTFHITTKEKQEKVELDNEIKQTVEYINNLKPFEIAQKIHMASTKYTLKPEQIDYITSNNKVFNEFIRIDLIIEAMIEKQKPPKDRTKYLAKSLGLDKVKFK